MKKKSLLYIGFRFLFGRRNSNLDRDLARKAVRGAVFSIAISLIPLITVMQIADGMIQGITARFMELGTYHMQIHPYPGFSLSETEKGIISTIPGVTGLWQETQSLGAVFTKGKQEGVIIRAVENGYLKNPGTLKYMQLVEGELELSRPMDALIGSALAKKLDLHVGDPINLITLNQSFIEKAIPRISVFIIRGIVSAGYRKIDSQWLLLPQQAAGRVLSEASSKQIYGLKIEDPFTSIQGASVAVIDKLPSGFQLYTWQQLERNNFESLASTRTMLLLIMVITVAVASVNVASALSTLAMERAQEIAILKCMGARPADMIVLFSISGALLGALGAILGSIGGMLTSMHINEIITFIERTINLSRALLDFGSRKGTPIQILDPGYYLEKIPISIQFPEIATLIYCTIILSMLSACIPAVRSAKMTPLNIFRKH